MFAVGNLIIKEGFTLDLTESMVGFFFFFKWVTVHACLKKNNWNNSTSGDNNNAYHCLSLLNNEKDFSSLFLCSEHFVQISEQLFFHAQCCNLVTHWCDERWITRIIPILKSCWPSNSTSTAGICKVDHEQVTYSFGIACANFFICDQNVATFFGLLTKPQILENNIQ